MKKLITTILLASLTASIFALPNLLKKEQFGSEAINNLDIILSAEDLKIEKQNAEEVVPATSAEVAAAPEAKETADSLLAQEGLEGGLKIKRAKGSKNVTSGVCHVLATFNNTKVVFSDVKGNVLGWSSAGRCNFKGSRKSTAYAAQVVIC